MSAKFWTRDEILHCKQKREQVPREIHVTGQSLHELLPASVAAGQVHVRSGQVRISEALHVCVYAHRAPHTSGNHLMVIVGVLSRQWL